MTESIRQAKHTLVHAPEYSLKLEDTDWNVS